MNKQQNPGPMVMDANTGLLRPATAQDQMQVQKNMIFVQAAISIMSELTSIAYANAINDAKVLKMQNIKDDLKQRQAADSDLNSYYDEEELNKEAIHIFNSDPKLEVKFDLGMPADVALAATQTLFQKLGI